MKSLYEENKTMEVKKNMLVVVAHPDDETLWCGGTMLLHPDLNWFVACLCRKNDTDRGPKFKEALKVYKANGIMGNLDDGPEQTPLDKKVVKKAILDLVPKIDFDLILTHSPLGEYTRHLRHEEIGRGVMDLWSENKISTQELWIFAYEDGNKKYHPRTIERAAIQYTLPTNIWNEKFRIITEIYGFRKSGFEAKTTPKTEGFWQFKTPKSVQNWLGQEGIQQYNTYISSYESLGPL